jgi:hypothetical protein
VRLAERPRRMGKPPVRLSGVRRADGRRPAASRLRGRCPACLFACAIICCAAATKDVASSAALDRLRGRLRTSEGAGRHRVPRATPSRLSRGARRPMRCRVSARGRAFRGRPRPLRSWPCSIVTPRATLPARAGAMRAKPSPARHSCAGGRSV